jgi:hypothetical protein
VAEHPHTVRANRSAGAKAQGEVAALPGMMTTGHGACRTHSAETD